MSRGGGLALLGGGGVCAVLGWIIVASTDASGERPSPSPVVSADTGVAEAPDRRSLGVGARGADSARALLVGRIEELDGAPLTEGRVRLTCAGSGGSRAVGSLVVEVDAEGLFRGSGCARACAEFIHPSMIQTAPWVLTAGREEVWVVRPLGRRGGLVTGPDGEPVAAARLHLDLPNEPASGPAPVFTSANTVSDGDGRFSFAVAEEHPCDPCQAAKGRCVEGREGRSEEPMTLELSARASGFRSARRQVSTGPDEPWTVVLEAPAATTHGRLVDEEGRAYPRAKILARSTEHPTEIHRASLDGAEFELGDLGDGTYEVRAVQDGIELASAEAIVAGEELELLGGLPAIGVELRLRLVDGERAGVSGVLVDGGPFVAAESDARGELRATGVLPGAYVLRLRPPGRGALRHRLMVRDGESSVTEQIKLEGGR